MNQCILMADITRNPELRYTSDTQTPLAEMLVQFPGLRPDDPPTTLKVIGWGNLAQEIQENYHEGDRVLIEGRLSMNTIERPEGFKEKRAELVAQRIHRLGADTPLEMNVSSTSSNTYSNSPPASGTATPTANAPSEDYAAANPAASNPDDIPF